MVRQDEAQLNTVVAWAHPHITKIHLSESKARMEARGPIGARVAGYYNVPLVLDPGWLGAQATSYRLEGGVRVEMVDTAGGQPCWIARNAEGQVLTREGVWSDERQVTAGAAGQAVQPPGRAGKALVRDCGFRGAADAIRAVQALSAADVETEDGAADYCAQRSRA